jgi:putative N6-adenine-specific DNA methylase
LYEYQKNGRYFARVAGEIVEPALSELASLGAFSLRPVHRGIHFETDPEGLRRITYHTRLATRVLAPLLRFKCHAPKYLYKKARLADWQELMGNAKTFAVSASVANSRIRHSGYAALKLKDAVVDSIREDLGTRPDIDRRDPDVRLFLHIENNTATILLDVSGGSLHRRGYRVRTVEAPMQETLAAAVIRLIGWDGSTRLADPMCGSGTLLCEALLSYCRTPSQFLRPSFGFEFLPEFDPAAWHSFRREADRAARALPPGLIAGSDSAPEAVRAARDNLNILPHGHAVRVRRSDFRDTGPLEAATIVCNPPYGIRLGSRGEAGTLYGAFGDFLKHSCRGSSAYVYFGDPSLIPAMGLRPAWKRPLKNGPLDGRLTRFDIY